MAVLAVVVVGSNPISDLRMALTEGEDIYASISSASTKRWGSESSSGRVYYDLSHTLNWLAGILGVCTIISCIYHWKQGGLLHQLLQEHDGHVKDLTGKAWYALSRLVIGGSALLLEMHRPFSDSSHVCT